jgi:hypothetical protein
MTTSLPLFEKLQRLYNNLDHRGLDFFNDYFPKVGDNSDLFSERVKTIILTVCAFSMMMLVISPIGFLYACLPRPFYVIIMYALNLPDAPIPPSPEWGMHYITLLTYALFAYIGMEYIESQGIKKPIQKIIYVGALTEITFFVPFEYIYVTLYDIFHNIPYVGYPAFWYGDFGRMGILYGITHSVMLIDITITVICFILLYYTRKDLGDYYIFKPIKFNRISKILLSLFLIAMAFWVLIPLVQPDIQGWGTQWFPQTIYVKYGYFIDYGIDVSKMMNYDPYGIVQEFWYPNDLVKYANHISKIFSVAFMFYTFLPRIDYDAMKRVDMIVKKEKDI